MTTNREALREAVARAIAPKAWAMVRKGQPHLMQQERDVSFRKADAALGIVVPACQEAAMPPPLSDPATPDYMADSRYRAGRHDAGIALAVFLPEKTDG